MPLTPTRPADGKVTALLDTPDGPPAPDEMAVFVDQAVALAKRYAARCNAVDQETLDAITLQLAAHVAASRYRSLTSESFGDSSYGYAGKFGMGLDATRYGQDAKALDPCGVLSKLGREKVTLGVSGRYDRKQPYRWYP